MKLGSLMGVAGGVLLICLCIASVNAAPVAAFSSTPLSGPAPLSVTFTDASTGSPTGWAWFFGDENWAAPAWTQVKANDGNGWSARSAHSSVSMPDGSIVLMGGNDGNYKNDVWRSTDNGVTWTQQTPSAGWSARSAHSSVAIPDGSIVLMGGNDGNYKNDVWRSTDNGVTWTQQTVNAGWSGRYGHGSVVMPDGSIVLMGGFDGDSVLYNDVWRSTDNGVTWTQQTVNAGWSGRYGHSIVAMPDGSIVLMGGNDGSGYYKNEVWRSTDNGVTWMQITPGADWSARYMHSSVVMPDGSILLMGGNNESFANTNDVWRSTDNGITWTQQTANAGWSARSVHSSVAMPDGSIVLMGGYDKNFNMKNDVWRSVDNGVTWTQQTASAGWSARHFHSSVAMPDGSILLMGGFDGDSVLYNDAWRSTDNGVTWTQQTANAGWSARAYHSSVAMPDGSILLMGGMDPTADFSYNDVWRSTDNGVTWTQQTASAGWSARAYHSSVAMPDGSIILTGGIDGSVKNDVWLSTDNGVTWTQQTASAGWSARSLYSSVVMPDGSIVLMGGNDGSYRNDVWRSMDNGVTWTQQTASAGWSARSLHSSVAMPDGSILLMGGNDGSYRNDLWRSMDNGVTWTQQTASAGWSARSLHSSIVMPDGSILLMGGVDNYGNKNDVWRFMPVGSTEQNPSHTYTLTGNYSVALQAYSSNGCNSIRKTGYISVLGPPVAQFTANITSGKVPLPVSFTDHSANSPASWSWSFGDGNFSELRNPVHTYTTEGTYTVSLNAINAFGSNVSVLANYIVVHGPDPVPDFSANVTSGTAPLVVSFTDLSLNNPTGWAWYFGDENYAQAWTQQTANAGWSPRQGHSSVAMPDGSIVLMGGFDGGSVLYHDVWRSMDYGATWKQQTAGAGWSARVFHSSVAMPDGSIILMGGNDGSNTNDVWRSTDNGVTWTQQTANAGWSPRQAHSNVAMPDGSILLMGGNDGSNTNEVWRSTDNGATWTQQTANAGWSPRQGHSSVAIPDGSIVLMGGFDGGSVLYHDVWRSMDNGATWKQQTASAGWSARVFHSSVAMPDGSILMIGGNDGSVKNDVWRSMDNGATWTRMTASAGWTARYLSSSGAMPDGSIVLMGGVGDGTAKNDVWRFTSTGSSLQNPTHTYTAAGNYSVALQAYNSDGYTSLRKTGYICVGVCVLPLPGYTSSPTDPDHDGIYEDLNGNGRLDFADVVLYFNQMEWIAANEPVSAFDLNGNSRIDFADIVKLFGEI